MSHHPTLVFFLYVSRSGSTFLATQLSKHSRNLLIVPEFNFLAWLLKYGDAAVRELSGVELYNIMRSDYQIQNLLFSDQDLRELADDNRGKGLHSLFENVICRYGEKVNASNPEIVLLKKGRYLHHMRLLSELFPDAKVLHIYRDARACINSMLHTKSVYFPGNMGQSNVIFASRLWNNYLNRVCQLHQDSPLPLIEVQYEELCLSPEKVVQEVLDAIGSQSIPSTGEKKSARFKVATAETSIHQLVDESPVVSRIDAWKDELAVGQGVVVELLTRPTLVSHGYDLWYLSMVTDAAAQRYLQRARLNHVWRTATHTARRFVFYLRHRRQVAPRIGMEINHRLRSVRF